MDPGTASALAASIVAALSPIVSKGAEEVAKTVFKDAYAAIKKRLSRHPEGKETLKRFEVSPASGADDLQRNLTELLTADAELIKLLVEALQKSAAVEHGSLVGKIEAEKAVVADKIDAVNM
jgi:hypothetical protein